MTNIQQKSIKLNVPVNYFCNQKCFFCSEGDKEKFKYLKNNEDGAVYKLLNDGIGKFRQVVFTSGEPTLNKNLGKYIKKAKNLGYRSIGLITNGTQMYKDDLRKELLEAGLDEITFSIHGSNAIIHEKNIGVKGVYSNVILGLLKTRKNSKKVKINISMVLNKYNIFDLFNCIFKYQKLGIDIFLINTMRPDGYGKDKMTQLSIKYMDFVEYINTLSIEKIEYLNKLIKISKLNIMDIPICFLQKTKLDIKGYGKVEVRFIKDLKEVNTADNKVYFDKCNDCEYIGNCEGVYKDYIGIFGEEEFIL